MVVGHSIVFAVLLQGISELVAVGSVSAVCEWSVESGERDCAGGGEVRACQRPCCRCRDEASGVEGYKRMEAQTRPRRVGKKVCGASQPWKSASCCYLGRVGCRIHGSLRNADRAEPH